MSTDNKDLQEAPQAGIPEIPSPEAPKVQAPAAAQAQEARQPERSEEYPRPEAAP